MIPLMRSGDEEHQRTRAIRTVQRFKSAKLSVEGKPGAERRNLWLTISQATAEEEAGQTCRESEEVGHQMRRCDLQAKPGSGDVYRDGFA